MFRVLVVDDDFMVARVNRGYVEQVPGFTVAGEAYTGSAAVAAVGELAPDLVLLDIYLPDISGLEVLQRLRADRHPVDVLAVTAAKDTEVVRQAIQGGVVHYLVKPFTFAALRERLEGYAEARRRLERAGESGQAGQDDIDRLFGAPSGSGARPLPKGLSAATRDVVAQALRAAGDDLSAAEVAQRTGLSRVSARRYLEHLTGTEQVELRLQYGGAGRPEHRYRWSAGGG